MHMFRPAVCAPVWMGLLNSVVRSAESMCEGELCCNAFSLLYEIYHKVNHSTNEYQRHFVAVCSTRASAAQGELALVILLCKIDHFSRSFFACC